MEDLENLQGLEYLRAVMKIEYPTIGLTTNIRNGCVFISTYGESDKLSEARERAYDLLEDPKVKKTLERLVPTWVRDLINTGSATIPYWDSPDYWDLPDIEFLPDIELKGKISE